MNVQLIRTRGVFIKHETYEVSLVGITQQIVPVLKKKKEKKNSSMFWGESQWTALWHTAYLGSHFIITWVPLYSDHLISLSGVERKNPSLI